MRTVLNIARTELRQLFSSPVAWLILAVFSFQTGLYFTQLFNEQVTIKEVGDSLLPQSNRIYSYFFRKIQEYLYLYIPLLTMGLLSLERKNQTIKLLYSSPITNAQIVSGKYVSMMIYNLIIVAILLVPVAFGAIYIPHLDFGLVSAAILGLYLLACAYSAVGLFMSSLTSYQIFAGLSTLTLLSLLTMAGKMWQNVPVLRDVAYWVSISGRATRMTTGLICSEDVLYFIFISLFFIALTICKLGGERNRKSRMMKSLEYAATVLAVVACGYISAIPQLRFYADATATRQNTVAVPTVQALEAVDGNITVTTFVNLLDKNANVCMPDQRVPDKKRFEPYSRFNKGMRFEYVYYYGPNTDPDLERKYPGTTDKEKMQNVCNTLGYKESFFKTAQQVESEYGVDLSSEGYKLFRRLTAKNGGSSTLRLFNDPLKHPRENEVASAVRQLSIGTCKVGYVTGHGERSIHGTADRDLYVNVKDITNRKAWINHGFDPVEVNLAEGVPEDVEILVVADPKMAYGEDELSVIRTYLEGGGNALLCSESGHQQYADPVAGIVGLQYRQECLLQDHDDFEPELVLSQVDSSAFPLYSYFKWMKRWDYRIPMSMAVGYDQVEDKGFERIDLFDSGDGCPVLSQMTRTVGDKQQRIIVSSATNWLTNAESARMRAGIRQNNSITYDYIWTYLSSGKYPCNVDHPADKDRANNATLSTSVAANVIFMAVIPLLMVILSIVIRLIRKRQ